MFKVLLAWRYLRTRYIALASIISVTLGVATMIVVNSVMAGFSEEMHTRLHGILSDIVIESPAMRGIENPDWYMASIREELGADVVGMTTTVHVPAMISFRYRGRWINQQITLIGIDPATYSQVSDFSKHLLHPGNREFLDFKLRDGGYAPDRKSLRYAGWRYRRIRYAPMAAATQSPASSGSGGSGRGQALGDGEPAILAAQPPTRFPQGQIDLDEPATNEPASNSAGIPQDPFASEHAQLEGRTFDPTKDQHTGLILGIAIASQRVRPENAAGGDEAVEEMFLLQPGDDVQLTFPNAGTPPRPQSNTFTIVDFYESKMSEYDSGFAFVPLKSLQHYRAMGGSVTSIQLKLRPGADLKLVKQKLEARFPPREHQFHIRTWRDLRAPLLSAVQLETTILNVLLFLIIAVAGFGILATFFMIVRDKTRDIGILKSLGARSHGVMSIFLTYGFSLGIVGSGVGLILGLLFVWNINKIADWLSWLTGREIFDQTVYYFSEIPTSVEPWTVFWVAVGAIGIAVLASILPARQAAKLHPVEALRYE